MSDTTSTETTASGRFVLRLDPSLHHRLREEARDAGVSLNELCRRKLEASMIDLPPALDAALAHADDKLQGILLGIVVYGSWARGEATPESDIDLLLVLKPEVALDREIYRRWDDDPPAWDGMPFEPHFVRLPDPDREITSTWAEAALDGIVLRDPSLMVSRALGSIRRAIADGEIVRRSVHGQPYWVTPA